MRTRPRTYRTIDTVPPRMTILPTAILVGVMILAIASATFAPRVAAAIDPTSPWRGVAYAGQRQEHAQWCAPASASMSLASVGVRRGQSTLASASGTTLAGGTSDTARYVLALNRAAEPVGVTYSLTVEPDAQALGVLLGSEIEHGYIPIQPVVYGRLPYAANHSTEGHLVTVVAVAPSLHEVRIWDPDAPRVGEHVLTYTQLWEASQGHGITYVMTGEAR